MGRESCNFHHATQSREAGLDSRARRVHLVSGETRSLVRRISSRHPVHTQIACKREPLLGRSGTPRARALHAHTPPGRAQRIDTSADPQQPRAQATNADRRTRLRRRRRVTHLGDATAREVKLLNRHCKVVDDGIPHWRDTLANARVVRASRLHLYPPRFYLLLLRRSHLHPCGLSRVRHCRRLRRFGVHPRRRRRLGRRNRSRLGLRERGLLQSGGVRCSGLRLVSLRRVQSPQLSLAPGRGHNRGGSSVLAGELHLLVTGVRVLCMQHLHTTSHRSGM